MGRRLGRPKAGQAVLTRNRILTTALQLIDAEGIGSLSMRRLATELGVDPMAIYHHLPSKATVLAGVVERVFDDLQLPEIHSSSWQEQVRAFARSYYNLTCAHPNLVFYLVTDPECSSSAALAANEILYAALMAAGLPPRLIVLAADLVVDYLNGFALAASSGHLNQPGERQVLLAKLKEHPPEQFPALHQVFKSLTVTEMQGDIEVGLEIILAGIESIAQRNNS